MEAGRENENLVSMLRESARFISEQADALEREARDPTNHAVAFTSVMDNMQRTIHQSYKIYRDARPRL